MTILANRAQETTQTQGTGAYSLDGAVTSRQTLVDAAASASGDGTGPWTVAYVVDDDADYEIGTGVLTAGSPDTLTRASIVESTNGGSAVNWGSGTRNVIVAPDAVTLALLYAATHLATASTLVFRDGSGNLRVGTASNSADAINKGDAESYADGIGSTAATYADSVAGAASDAAAAVASDLSDHEADDAAHGATAAATGDRIALRTATGQCSFGDPSANSHAATKSYVDTAASPEQAWFTAGGENVSWSHGLGVVPKGFECVAVCKTTEGGWAVDDEVTILPYDSGSSDLSVAIYRNASAVGITFRSTSFQLLQKASTSGFVPTAANWRVKFYVRKN